MVAYGKIYFEVQINNQYNWLKNNTTQFYLILLGRAKLSWNSEDPGLQPYQYLYKYVDQKWLSHQKVSRCHTRGESEEIHRLWVTK